MVTTTQTARDVIGLMIQHVASKGFPNSESDVAIKLNFFNGIVDLLSVREKNECMNGTLVRPNKWNDLMDYVGTHLLEIVEETFRGNSVDYGTGNQYLSVIVYGLSEYSWLFDFYPENGEIVANVTVTQETGRPVFRKW